MADRGWTQALLCFAGVGVLNTALDFTVFAFGVHALGWPLLGANALAWSIAVTFSYLANGRWTFARSWSALLRPFPYFQFALANALSFALATSTLLVLAPYPPVLLAKAASLALGFAVNFLVAKHFIFARLGIA